MIRLLLVALLVVDSTGVLDEFPTLGLATMSSQRHVRAVRWLAQVQRSIANTVPSKYLTASFGREHHNANAANKFQNDFLSRL